MICFQVKGSGQQTLPKDVRQQVEEYPEEEEEIPSDTDERLLDDAPHEPVLLLDNRPHSPADSEDMDQALQHDELRAFAKVWA